jgi:DNA repair exonuclease SbcCD ATPase subunit
MSSLYKYIKRLDRFKGRRDYVQSQIEDIRVSLEEERSENESTEQAKEIIKSIAVETQREVGIKLGHIVTLAIEAIFGERRYDFEVSFVEKRGRSETEFWLIEPETGERMSPFDVGGSVVDIICIALKIAVWSLSKTINLLVLDEPFRFLSTRLHENAARFLDKVSKELDLQIILITHNDGLKIGKIILIRKGLKYSRVVSQ